nr:RALF8 [Fragaria x ananassa]
MDFKLCLVALLLALAVAVEAAKLHDVSWGLARYTRDSSLVQDNVGNVIGEDNEMMLDSESSRRTLAGRTRYISYGALKRNRIPCRRRGASYYNCGRPNQQANTYRRGCSVITRCARFN